MTRNELIGKLCVAVFEQRAEATHSQGPGRIKEALRVPYAESVIEYRSYHKAIRVTVEKALEAIDSLGFAVVDLNQYIPKKRVVLTRTKPLRTRPRMNKEIYPAPPPLQRTVKLGVKRRKGDG